jgi:pimeloyl-ACP methyl ester carboxylesterase
VASWQHVRDNHREGRRTGQSRRCSLKGDDQMATQVETTPLSEPATTGSQLNAPNLSIEVDGENFVYRRFGNTKGDTPPLLCLQHFRGNLDGWDSASVDRIALDREVILLANRGVGGSSGRVPDNVTDMARDTIAFVGALGLKEIDLLGYSLGGYIAQEMALLRPRLVRRIILAGTAPRGGPRLHRWTDKVFTLAAADVPSPENFLGVFFSGSEESRAKGMEYLGRIRAREAESDRQTDLATRDAQLAAIAEWGIPDESRLNRLAGIIQPTFVANGDNDEMMHTSNSVLLAEKLPNSQLRIYPDANHGFLYQYPELFADHVRTFLAD